MTNLTVVESPEGIAAQMILALPVLVDRAAAALAGARSAAEILEARDKASIAYDAAKRTVRFAKAKKAHDELIAAAYRAQADALVIEAQAKCRLADEYDAAQERGEIGQRTGRPKVVPVENDFVPTAADVGLTRRGIHDDRIIRDAEAVQPGIVRQTINEALMNGEEPTKADVKRAALRVVKDSGNVRQPRRQRPEPVQHTQYDRDLAMIVGVWGAACDAAQTAFLETICSEFKLKSEH